MRVEIRDSLRTVSMQNRLIALERLRTSQIDIF